MKIKMPCKLCEVSLDHSKLGVANCTHSTFPFPPQIPIFLPPIFNLGTFPIQNTSMLRDMMLAAYLFKGYYQPAGPLINVPQHGHPQSTSLGKTAPLSEVSSSPTPPPSHQTHSQSSTTDSLDSDVIITSATTAKEAIPPQHPPPPPPPTYRYSQYHPPHPGYAYGYPPQYYPSPHHPASYHHDLCYPNPYLHHKPYPPPTYRRHLTAPAGTQYYQANPPDIYHPPPPAPTQQNQQVVTANPPSSTYQSAPSGPPPLLESYPPPPTLVEPYPPPPHYYPGYGPAPPPACYTHSPPSRTLPYLNAAYQSCPCPMQSCPKNVHTGPLTGDSKRSSHISSIAKDSLPLPPVALALPLEPVSATGPPSPARGSAGMPPPPSPAGATYQPPPPAPKQEELESVDCKPIEKRRKARVGKNMVRNNIAANFPENTMLLMCHQPTQASMCVTNVKREIESPEGKVCVSEEALKSKVEPPEIRLPSETIEETACVKNEKIAPCLKTEVSTKEEKAPLELEEEKKVSVDQLPCQKTVAENVKVKNMKRKLSILNEKPDVASPPPQKKQKLDKVMKANGSYKDLIKKNVPSIKINNGKRKLNIDAVIRPMLIKNSKLKIRKSSVKRKLSPSKDELHSKRAKLSRPLIASNLHNSKQNLKTLKGKCSAAFDLSENKEPAQKTTLKKLQVNSKNSISEKKLAPEILDHLFAKNNVDRTIDCVVNRYSEILRTSKRSEASKIDDQSRKLKINNNPECVVKSTNVNNNNSASLKSKVVTPKKVGASKRKCKRKSVEVPVQVVPKVPRRQLQVPKWSNGWTWKGEPYQAKVFLNSDETVVVRKCYPAMMHAEGDTIEPKDCVLLKAGPRRNDLPFVAKVATLWENPDDGEMMMSLLWYYRPEHTEQGRQDYDESDEVFASRHKDTNSVACIEDKCFVLTFNEYCRYRKSLRRIEEGMEDTSTCIPNPEPYPRSHRQPPSTCLTSYDLIFFCRRVYDFRQKRIVKNPS
uniref:BAH domain-containing protein n=1 Tax=Photinus pyralis TaxID=7054 RepID=A0A1Y1LJP6_PHOPY